MVLKKHFFLLSMCYLILLLMKIVMQFFQDSLMTSLKEQHLFEIKTIVMWYNVFLFTVTFDQKYSLI